VSLGPSSLNCVKNVSRNALWKDNKYVFEVARLVVEKLNSEGKNLFIIANMGLWYNDRWKLEDDAPFVLDWLASLSRSKTNKNYVFWHETMSQHWPNEYGNF